MPDPLTGLPPGQDINAPLGQQDDWGRTNTLTAPAPNSLLQLIQRYAAPGQSGLPMPTGQPSGYPNYPTNQDATMALNINPRDPNNDITNFIVNLMRGRQQMVPANQLIPYGNQRFAAQGQQPLRAETSKGTKLPSDFAVKAPNGQTVYLNKQELDSLQKQGGVKNSDNPFWLDYMNGRYAAR